MEITLGTSIRLYRPEDGDVEIPKGVVHSLKTHKGVACIFEERTDPMVSRCSLNFDHELRCCTFQDDEKEIFFRNLLGEGSLQANIFDLAQTCYNGDTRPAFPGHFTWLEKAVSRVSIELAVVLYLAHIWKFVIVLGGYIAPMLGYRLKYELRKKQA
jgi:hypothetical protein